MVYFTLFLIASSFKLSNISQKFLTATKLSNFRRNFLTSLGSFRLRLVFSNFGWIVDAKIGENFGINWGILIPLDHGLMIVVMFVCLDGLSRVPVIGQKHAILNWS